MLFIWLKKYYYAPYLNLILYALLSLKDHLNEDYPNKIKLYNFDLLTYFLNSIKKIIPSL